MSLTDQEIIAAARTPVDCPIEWCTGHRLDHGFDGAEPEQWTHSGVDEALTPFATGTVMQIGADRPEYWIDLELEETCTPAQLRVRAAELRLVATQLENAAERVQGLS